MTMVREEYPTYWTPQKTKVLRKRITTAWEKLHALRDEYDRMLSFVGKLSPRERERFASRMEDGELPSKYDFGHLGT